MPVALAFAAGALLAFDAPGQTAPAAERGPAEAQAPPSPGTDPTAAGQGADRRGAGDAAAGQEADERGPGGDAAAGDASTAAPATAPADPAAAAGEAGQDGESGGVAVAPDAFVSRIEANIELDRLLAIDHPREALPVGQRLVELTEQEFGKESTETAEAYMDFGEAQRRATEYEAAERSFLQAIDIYRALDGPFSGRAVEPLTSLGDTYHESGDYLSAVSAYGEARTVSRRTYGLLNESQIPLLDKMTRSLVELNNPVEADEQQLEVLRIVERNHAPDSDEFLGALYKYAAWLGESGRYQDERDQYGRALRIIRDRYGKGDRREVRPLLGIGNSFRNQRIPEGQGIGALRDALARLEAEPDPDERMLAEALRDIGDWQVAFAKIDYDGAEYRRAWNLLGDVAGGEQLRDEWFSGANYVLREPISLRGLSDAPNAPMGRVLVRFDLDRAGHTDAVAIVESDPPGLKDESVLRHIRRSRFRPQMRDGELVPAKGLALQFNYRYDRDALLENAGEAKGKG